MRHEGRTWRDWETPSSGAWSEAHHHGGTSTADDLVSQYALLNTMLMDRMNQMVMNALMPILSRERKLPVEGHMDECCNPCKEDPCHCRCCIGDADLVVYARSGEVRIVPVRIENRRRRERQITLTLSGWTTHGGKQTGVHASILPSTEFTLEACGEREIILRIDLSQIELDQTAGTNDKRMQDVDDCLVLYADLRVEGCDIRPIRISVAILPRDCSPYVIHCCCSCCRD